MFIFRQTKHIFCAASLYWLKKKISRQKPLHDQKLVIVGREVEWLSSWNWLLSIESSAPDCSNSEKKNFFSRHKSQTQKVKKVKWRPTRLLNSPEHQITFSSFKLEFHVNNNGPDLYEHSYYIITWYNFILDTAQQVLFFKQACWWFEVTMVVTMLVTPNLR